MKPKSDNKIYEALMVEKEVRKLFKEKKPKNKTNTEFLNDLLNLKYAPK